LLELSLLAIGFVDTKLIWTVAVATVVRHMILGNHVDQGQDVGNAAGVKSDGLVVASSWWWWIRLASTVAYVDDQGAQYYVACGLVIH
jgi:hypothetical protein